MGRDRNDKKGRAQNDRKAAFWGTFVQRALKKYEYRHYCHAELVSASNKINRLRDPENKFRVTKRGFFRTFIQNA